MTAISTDSALADAAAASPGDAMAPGVTDLRLLPLGFGLKTAYGFGSVVEAFANTSLTYFLFFYVTAVCGLSGTLAGLSAFVALAVDSIADPAIGLWSDNTASRFGRRHPFMLASIVPLAVTFGLLFSIPLRLTGWSIFAYVTAVSLALRFSMSLFLLPFIALGAELSDDYTERSTIVAFRLIFGTIATFACFGLVLLVYMPGPNGQLDRAAYTPFGWTGALLILVAGLVATLGTRGAIARLHGVVPMTGSVVRRFIRELGEIFRNPSFVALFLAVLIFFVAQGAAAALTVHANKYFWALSPSSVLGVFLGLAAGPIVGLPLTLIVSRHVEKRTISIAGLIVFCISQFGMPVAKIAGILPQGGGALFAILAINFFVLGATLAAVTVAFQSMLADAADEHELLFGVRREGLFYAGLTLSAKAAGGLGAFIAGIALDAIYFPSNIAAQGAHLHLTAGTIRNLGLVYGPLPALMTLVGLIFMFRYHLTRAKHANILVELNARRSA
ncbi:MAG: MFS transporter [Rhizomicrobium sp.]|jgi:GPH family glycoside/pentoside/hexuronide:cation symporter